MHGDVGVHLGDLDRSDGRPLDFTAGRVGPPVASWSSVHPDVVELAVLFDHFNAYVADICYGHFDCVTEVLRPLEAHYTWETEKERKHRRVRFNVSLTWLIRTLCFLHIFFFILNLIYFIYFILQFLTCGTFLSLCVLWPLCAIIQRQRLFMLKTNMAIYLTLILNLSIFSAKKH